MSDHSVISPRKIHAQRYSDHMKVYGWWVTTLLVALLVYVAKPVLVGASIEQYMPHLKSVAAMITPQLAIMATFFFKMNPETRAYLLRKQSDVSRLPIIVAAIYNIVFILCLVLGVGLELFGARVGAATGHVCDIMLLMSVLGLPIVAGMFVPKSEQVSPAEGAATTSVEGE